MAPPSQYARPGSAYACCATGLGPLNGPGGRSALLCSALLCSAPLRFAVFPEKSDFCNKLRCHFDAPRPFSLRVARLVHFRRD